MVQYKTVPGYPEYRVGDDGSVWSRYAGRGRNKQTQVTDTWKQLRPTIRNGYPVINLCSGGKRRTWLLHRLVLLSFIGPDNGLDGCHNDGDPTNCALTNLRYDTRKGNMADQLQHGTRNRGERQGHVKLTEDDVRLLRNEYAKGGVSQQELAERLGVTVMAVNCALLRKTWAWLE